MLGVGWGAVGLRKGTELRELVIEMYRVFFFIGPPPKNTKSKIVLEYLDWASPGPPKKVKVHGLGLP